MSEYNLISNSNKTAKNYPLISVVMITYAHENYIEQAINGVLIQQYKGVIELIIANDKSPDRTDGVVGNIIKTHPNGDWIKYTSHDKNLGMMPNFIWSLKEAKGNYIALCEGDDYWTDPLKLQKQVDFLETNKDHVICGTYIDSQTDDGLIKNSNDLVFESQDFYGIVKNNKIKTLTSLFRNIKIVLPENVNFGDMALLFELTKNGAKAAILPFNSAVYRIHSGGVYSSQNFKTLVKRGFDDILVFLINNPKNFKMVSIYSKMYLFKSLKEFVRGLLRRPNSDITIGYIYLEMFYKINKLSLRQYLFTK